MKNINNECVPCSGTDCDDCGKNQIRDICGKCMNTEKTEPSVVEGKCNGIRTMLEIQGDTDKEIAGFFTKSGKMIILTNDDSDTTHAYTEFLYRDSSENPLYSFDENEGKWYVTYYENGESTSSEEIEAHFHTHPNGDGAVSKEDKAFTQGGFSGINHYYTIYYDGMGGNNVISEYDKDGIVKYTNEQGVEKERLEFVNCKKNPDETNCN